MFLIRDVFNTKPGKAKELVAMMKKAAPHMRTPGIRNMRVMTDTVGGYWTEAAELQAPLAAGTPPQSPDAEAAMTGYMDLVNGGHREIFRIE